MNDRQSKKLTMKKKRLKENLEECTYIEEREGGGEREREREREREKSARELYRT